jgi:hypothetical protein
MKSKTKPEIRGIHLTIAVRNEQNLALRITTRDGRHLIPAKGANHLLFGNLTNRPMMILLCNNDSEVPESVVMLDLYGQGKALPKFTKGDKWKLTIFLALYQPFPQPKKKKQRIGQRAMNVPKTDINKFQTSPTPDEVLEFEIV